MHLGILLTGLNLVLNVILIRGLGPIPAFGTIGAAMGTVIAGGVVTGVAFYLLVRDRLVISLPKERKWKFDPVVLREVLRFGLPTGFQGVAMNLGGVFLIRFVGSLEQSAPGTGQRLRCATHSCSRW